MGFHPTNEMAGYISVIKRGWEISEPWRLLFFATKITTVSKSRISNGAVDYRRVAMESWPVDQCVSGDLHIHNFEL